MTVPTYLPYYVLAGTAGIILTILYGLNLALASAGWPPQERARNVGATALVLITWLVAAIALGAMGAFHSASGALPTIQYGILLPILIGILLIWRSETVKSIVDVKLPGSPNGPWDAKLLHVEGRDLSLNEIENSILRPGWKDPRIHFALNCASLGCPDLAGEAFTAENSERLLEEGARAFIASPRGAEFSGDTLRLSSIFDWYKTDFGKSPGDLLAWLASHAPKEKAARLKAHTGKIIYRYDWALNAKP